MSVGTLIKYRQRVPETEYLPLATQIDFQKYWLPIAEALGLQWVPLFVGGVTLVPEDIPAVLYELGRMQEAIAAADLPQRLQAQMLKRNGHIASLLTEIDPAAVADIFIG
jgi:hypothetical protein